MIVTGIHAVIAVVFLIASISIVISGVTLLQSEPVNVEAEITKYLEDEDNIAWVQDQVGYLKDNDAIKWTNANFVDEGEFSHHNDILNKTLEAVVKDLQSAGLAIQTINNKFIIIEHTQNPSTVITTTTSTARCAADFGLQTMKLTGEFQSEFPINLSVFIRGDYEAGNQGTYKIKKGDQVLKSATVPVASDGSFLGTFNNNLNAEVGQYTAEFEINGLRDCITFTIN